MYKGLRDFLQRLEREGELLRVGAEVSAVEEIAEITEREAKSPGGGKALLFERSGTDYPVVTNMFGSPHRMAAALGLDDIGDAGRRIEHLLSSLTAPRDTFADKLRMLPLLAEMSRWMPRQSRGPAPCRQCIFMGDEADLGRLPVLQCRGLDAGRFITLPMVNTLDPDTGARNAGMYRMQILGPRTAAMHWHIHKTGARHFEAWRRAGRRMPVAVTLGGDPAYTYAATAPLPDNVDEYMLAGFLRQRPVRLVRCLTNELMVPADCDFVIEGYVDPSEEPVREGPFGDHTGFFSLDDLYPVFHVTAITTRRDAVYPATVVGIPPQEDACIALATERIFLAPIRALLQPEIRDMSLPVEGTAHNIAVISLDSRYQGQALKTAQGLWGAGQMMFNKYMLAIPAGLDPHDMRSLAPLVRRADTLHRLTLAEGIYDILDHATSTPGFGGKALLDLTAPAAAELSPVVPESFIPAGGIDAADAGALHEWGALFLFAQPDTAVDIGEFMRRNGISAVKYILLLDTAAAGLSMQERIWLAAADSDPRRDLSVDAGGCVTIDSRSKRPGRPGHPSRFPNVVVSSAAVAALVDRRWAEYGLGEFKPSPSERYRPLLLSETEMW